MCTDDLNKLKEDFKDLSISDLGSIIIEGISVLFDKLKENGFDSEAIISGRLEYDWIDVYITGISNMSSGESTDFGSIHKI